ncbi:MAG: branched-chain amino acid ABC transporter permease [Deltaproteobacteria bacterium]|nr:branched-chain amino acid ABC transporter permease [Deltaproteobacteria bacterium]
MNKNKHALYLMISMGLFFCAVYLLDAYGNHYYQRVSNLMMIYVILTVSLNLSNGIVGISSLGQIGFMSIGAYVSAILTLPPGLKEHWLTGLPHWMSTIQSGLFPAMILAGILAAAIAFLVGIVILRLQGVFAAVTTLGFLIIVKVVAENWMTVTRGGRGISSLPTYTNLWWTSAVAVITVYVVLRIIRSPYGRSMLAVREHDLAAQSIGINAPRIRLLAFVISAFFTAVAGALWANLIGVVSPGSFYLWLTLLIIIMMVVGGMGSVTGSVFSAIGFTILLELLRGFENKIAVYGISSIIFAIVFMLVIIFHPDGVMGDREFSWDWFKRITPLF